MRQSQSLHAKHHRVAAGALTVQVVVQAVQGERAQFSANWFGRVDEFDML
jgi:hypothetical protein